MDFSRSKIFRAIALLLRLALGGIFVYAGWTKLKDPWALFAMAIDSYQVLPAWAVEWLARTLPWIELLIGAMLIAGRWMRISTVATSLLLLVFFSLMVRAHVKGIEINCGCFGPGEAISWRTLLRDGAMLTAALLLTTVTWAFALPLAGSQEGG
jgi:putative oxidoreductase